MLGVSAARVSQNVPNINVNVGSRIGNDGTLSLGCALTSVSKINNNDVNRMSKIQDAML